MTDLRAVFARAVVRRIAYVLVAAALAWLGIGRADAQTATHSSREEAYQHCLADKAQTQAYWSATGFPGTFGSDTCSDSTASQMLYRCTASQTESAGMGRCVHAFIPQGASCSSKACISSYHGAYQFTSDCPSNKPWNPVTKTCFDASQCASKPALGPTFTGGSMSPTTCVDGCKYSNPLGACLSDASGSACSLTGAKPTGQACGVGDVPPITDKPQQCTPNGNVCIKPDGQHCMAASNGRQLCWSPGETGVKNDGNIQQKRDAGTTPIPPNLQLPSGDNLQASGPPMQTTTITNNTTITTVTQNYQTQNGTSPGKNQGESSTGDGSGKEGDGDGDGTAAGGQNCESPPVMTGDPLVAMVATQAWQTRCAVEAGNAANVTGDIGNCSQPFSVQGTNANAHKLRAMRAQICPQGTAPDPSEYSGDADNPSSLFGEDHEIGGDGLDMSGLGFGQSCPSIPTVSVMGRTIAFDTSIFCDWMQLGGVFVRIIAALWCLRVIGGA